MNIFQKLYMSIVTSNDQEYIDRINTLKEEVKSVNAELNHYIDLLGESIKVTAEKQEELVKLQQENNSLRSEIELLKQTKDSQLEDYWNNKYKKAIIEYKGRPLPLKKTNIKIPVNVLITPNDPFIIQDLKKWGLYQTGEESDTLIPKIYKKIREEYYKYAFDITTWGNAEIWEFPFEVREARRVLKKGVDCDSWAHYQTSYYIAAGVPRWKVRVVVGDTDLGGHSTVYVYSKKYSTWHHLNSTYGKNYNKVYQYPTHKMAENGKDKIGINRVWLSFNDINCWYAFKGDIPKELQVQ